MYLFVCMYMYMYVCMYVCMHTRTHTHTHTHTGVAGARLALALAEQRRRGDRGAKGRTRVSEKHSCVQQVCVCVCVCVCA